MSILEQRLQRRGENNFDFLRSLAAALVIFHHSIALLGYVWNPLGNLTGYWSLGQLGVDIFFCISGLLVTRSWLADPRALAFTTKRCLRILPGLWLVLLLSACVAGPLLSSLPVRAYFANPNTTAYLWGLLVFPIHYFLPGVFRQNPNDAFNGSLWTLPLEMFAYLLTLAAGRAGWLTRRRFGLVLALLGAWVAYGCAKGEGSVSVDAVSVHLRADDESNLYFLLGAAAYVYRDSLRINGRLALLALALLLGTLSTGWLGYAVSFLALPYLLIYAALAPVPGLGRWSKYGDPSYGLYIYAFPIQQFFVWWLGWRHLSILGLTALSLPVTLFVAYASWHIVEKPALGLFRRWRSPRRAADAVPVTPVAAELAAAPL